MTDTPSILGRNISHYYVLEKLGGEVRASNVALKFLPDDISQDSQAIEKAFAAGYTNLNWASRDSDLDLLHDDPEFLGIVDPGETLTSWKIPWYSALHL